MLIENTLVPLSFVYKHKLACAYVKPDRLASMVVDAQAWCGLDISHQTTRSLYRLQLLSVCTDNITATHLTLSRQKTNKTFTLIILMKCDIVTTSAKFTNKNYKQFR